MCFKTECPSEIKHLFFEPPSLCFLPTVLALSQDIFYLPYWVPNIIPIPFSRQCSDGHEYEFNHPLNISMDVKQKKP